MEQNRITAQAAKLIACRAALRHRARRRECLRLCALMLAFCALCLGASQAAQAQQNAETGQVTVAFHGLKGRSGYLRVALYNRADSFPSGQPVAHKDVWLETLAPQVPLDLLTVTFDKLAPGVYAVCAFHDDSGSGRLTQNFLGIPQEEWGMSNNPRVRFRAPRFQQARFGLDPQQSRGILIILHR